MRSTGTSTPPPAGSAEGTDPAEAPDLLPLAVEEWLTWLATQKGRVPSTLAAYRRDVRRWWRWLRARGLDLGDVREDRKTTRLNSSHVKNSYAVFCEKKKKNS